MRNPALAPLVAILQPDAPDERRELWRRLFGGTEVAIESEHVRRVKQPDGTWAAGLRVRFTREDMTDAAWPEQCGHLAAFLGIDRTLVAEYVLSQGLAIEPTDVVIERRVLRVV